MAPKIKLVVKPYVVEDYLKNLRFIQQGVPKEALQGKEIQLTLEDMAKWRAVRQQIIEDFVEDVLPANLEKYFKRLGWRWNPEEPLKGWEKVKERLKDNTELEVSEEADRIRKYFNNILTFRDLDKEEREAVLLMYLTHISENIGKPSKEIRESFRRLTGISEGRLYTLNRLLWGLNLADVRPRGFPPTYYFEIFDYGREALRTGKIPTKALEEAPRWANRWFV